MFKIKTRQVMWVFVLAFVAVAVTQHPTTSAHEVKAAGNVLVGALGSVLDFFGALSA